ncbi:MAG: PadR family transcriptional regulator [Clostridiales bacterium]|nr:PadR family transcriptional regulator [Clostridiales bacterium]
MKINTKHNPLTEATFFILVSLITPLHGYGIIKKTCELSNNRVKLAPGTLYGALNSLIEKEYIKIAENNILSKKKKYIITELGLSALKIEIQRLHDLSKIGDNILKGEIV